MLLERKRSEQSFRLLPVLYGIEYSQCISLAQGYHKDVWVGNEDRPAEETLQDWAAAVEELLNITAVRRDQVGYLPLKQVVTVCHRFCKDMVVSLSQ